MSRFEVVPSAVEQAGMDLRQVSGLIGQVGGLLEATWFAAEATGDGMAAAAFTRMLSAWSTELRALSARAGELGVLTGVSAARYVVTDEGQMRLKRLGS
jgi:hypothetical protein